MHRGRKAATSHVRKDGESLNGEGILGEGDDEGGKTDIVRVGNFVEHVACVTGETEFGVEGEEGGGGEGVAGEGEFEGEGVEGEGEGDGGEGGAGGEEGGEGAVVGESGVAEHGEEVAEGEECGGVGGDESGP